MTEEFVIVETPRGDPVNNVEPGEPDGPEVGFWEVWQQVASRLTDSQSGSVQSELPSFVRVE